MAYLPPEDELLRQQAAQGQPTLTSGGPSAGATSAGTPSQSAPPSNPGNWVNINSYLTDAGKAGGQRLGQAIADNLGADAAYATSAVGASPVTTSTHHQDDNASGDKNAYTTYVTSYPQETDAQRQLASETQSAFDSAGSSAGLATLINKLSPERNNQYASLDAFLLQGGGGMAPITAAGQQWKDALSQAQGWQNQPDQTSTVYDPIQMEPGVNGGSAKKPVTLPHHETTLPRRPSSPTTPNPGGWQDQGEYTWDASTNSWKRNKTAGDGSEPSNGGPKL